MKKLLLIITLFAVANANAQFFAGIETKFGKGKTLTLEDAKFSYFVGVNGGYEFLNCLPVSVGIEYGKINASYTWEAFGSVGTAKHEQTAYRIPLKIGYAHTIKNFKPFINVGVFASLGNKGRMTPSIYKSVTHKTYMGYLGQIGLGYKYKKLLFTAAFEYNKSFNKMELDWSHLSIHAQYLGATIGVSYYF